MRVKEEQGYAALVAIMVMLVLTIIGTNLLSVVMTSLNQVRKTETRGEAEYFARMGMNEAMARLSKTIDDANAQKDGSTYAQIQSNLMNRLKENFHNFTQPVKDTSGNATAWVTDGLVPVTSSGINGSYQIMIRTTKIRDIKEDQPYVNKVEIRVIGKSTSLAEEPRTLEAVTYINTYPEEFRYVLSTPGSIHLNGSPYVEGDTFASSYYFHNYANYYLGVTDSQQIAPSQYPAMIGQLCIPFNGSETDKNAIKTSRFFYKPSEPGTYEAFDPNIHDISSKSLWYKVFTLTPFINLTEKPAFYPLGTSDIDDIPTIIATKKPAYPPVGYKELGDSIPGTPLTLPVSCPDCDTNLLIKDGVKIESGSTVETKGDLFIDGTMYMETSSTSQLILNGTMYVDGKSNLSQKNDSTSDTKNTDSNNNVNQEDSYATATLSGEIITNKDDSIIFINGNAVFDRLTMLKGKIYVNGNLRIQGNFKMNATVFVKGNVQFTEDDAQADFDPGENTLVILAGGKVEAYNLNLGKDTPQKLHTFIYSQYLDNTPNDPADTGIVLYGVGSNYQIVGGIYSKQNITLNAIKGTISLDTNSKPVSFKDTTAMKPDTARLSVLFNKELFENPPPGVPSAKTGHLKVTQYQLDTFKADDPTAETAKKSSP
ncbi:hypothetical protein ACQCN2_02255 [Brevibacillus ginsengisoli]|uniref:hypothetical protein n=1 Tax=Brevibacillus ginsengisoli TaxID=363854 RepID=UPI003CF5293A